jgi:hypothetical protein
MGTRSSPPPGMGESLEMWRFVHDRAEWRGGGVLAGIRGGLRPPRANEDSLQNPEFDGEIVDSHSLLSSGTVYVPSITCALAVHASTDSADRPARRSPMGSDPAAVHFVSPCDSDCPTTLRCCPRHCDRVAWTRSASGGTGTRHALSLWPPRAAPCGPPSREARSRRPERVDRTSPGRRRSGRTRPRGVALWDGRGHLRSSAREPAP